MALGTATPTQRGISIMNRFLNVWARRAVPITAAIALIVGFAGVAQPHDDEDYENAPPVHVGPHSGCHWSPECGYHCGAHVGYHGTEHHYGGDEEYYGGRGEDYYGDWGEDGHHHHHHHHDED